MLNILVAMPHTDIRDSFFTPETSSLLESLGTVYWNPHTHHYTPQELCDALKGVDICFTGWGVSAFTSEVLQKANKLKILAHTGGTVNNVATPELYASNVNVLSGNDVYALSVAEGTIAYMLLALRRLPLYMNMAQNQGWHAGLWYNEGLLGQSIGLIGFGAIARHLVELLRPFKMDIKVSSSHLTPEEAQMLGVSKASTEEIFSSCKIVSLHGASGPASHHMVNKELLQKLQDGALFLNTARGSIVDEKALAEEAQSGRFTAVLDVFEVEPLPMDSPLRGLDNIHIIPHMAGPTIDRRPVVVKELIADIKRFYDGKPLQMAVSQARAQHMSQ